MMKKRLLTMALMVMALVCVMTIGAGAANVGTEETGSDGTYTTIEAALTANATEITLTSDIALTSTLEITDDVTINLGEYAITGTLGSDVKGDSRYLIAIKNGASVKVTAGTAGEITSNQRIFLVWNGSLELESGNYTASVIAVGVRGSETSTDINYSTFTLGKDATLTAPYGAFVTYDDTLATKTNNSYGVTMTIAGTIDAGGYACLYVNGSLQASTNFPQITVKSTTNLTGGIYAAGNANWLIEGGTFNSYIDSVIEVKAGTMTIEGGTFTTTDATSQEPNSNGTSTGGYVLAIVDNKDYSTYPTTVTIKGGTFTGPIVMLDDDNVTTNNNDTLVIASDVTFSNNGNL